MFRCIRFYDSLFRDVHYSERKGTERFSSYSPWGGPKIMCKLVNKVTIHHRKGNFALITNMNVSRSRSVIFTPKIADVSKKV